MPIFRQNPLKKFTPKTAKFSDIYKKATNYNNFSTSAKDQIKSALKKTGYSDDKIRNIVYDESLSAKELRQIMADLSQHNISRIKDINADRVVQDHFHKEAVKKMNIARVRKERMMEELSRDNNSHNLNTKSQSPFSSPSSYPKQNTDSINPQKPKMPF